MRAKASAFTIVNHQEMSPSIFCKIFVFLWIFCLLSFGTKAAPTYLFHTCGNTSFYEPNSTYQANLNTLFTLLSSNATRESGFYNATAGRTSPNQVYGLFLCRGDVTTDVCRDCVATAGRQIVERCPRDNKAYIWYDECLLRYSNESIFSNMETVPSVSLLNTQNVTDQSRFMQLLAQTMNSMVPRAVVTDRSGKKFATAQANFTSFQTLYSLAQCTPDLTQADCNTCLQGAIAGLPNCCNGKQGGRVLTPSCNVRYELYPFYRITAVPPPPSPIAVPPPGETPPSRGSRRISSEAIAAIVAPIGVSVILFSIGLCFLITRSRSRKKYDAVQEDDVNDITTVQSLQFDLATVEAATNNFSDDNKIGEGGFGVVYKGILPSGREIAVKRLSQSSGQGAEEFKNEIVLVAKLQHRNLVQLLGFCLEGDEKILIYEYVPNKSLDYFLFDPEKRGQLNWSRRYKIIGGIARGILYLHEDSRLRIIHRDLKASNILIDGDMNPKISDFGMARIFGDQSQERTGRVVGTYGYMSPEYAMHGQFSVKSDVFSFGVLVLEIISGKKNSTFYQSDGAEDLLSYVWKHWKNGTTLELMDPSLADAYSRNEVLRCIQIGLLCVQEDVDARPSMATVVLMLDSHTVSLALPKEPPFFGYSRTGSTIPTGFKSDQSTSNSVPLSVNEVSITELYPR